MTTELAPGINVLNEILAVPEGCPDQTVWQCMVTLDSNGDLYRFRGVTQQDAIGAAQSKLQKMRDELNQKIEQLILLQGT